MGLLAAQMLTSPPTLAEFDRGEALYEHHCKSCHEAWAHTRDGRQVSNLADLRRRVGAWSLHSGLNWRDEEIADVADYLNREFYRFTDLQ
jgi:mono/diheme cytochrome c family protein